MTSASTRPVDPAERVRTRPTPSRRGRRARHTARPRRTRRWLVLGLLLLPLLALGAWLWTTVQGVLGSSREVRAQAAVAQRQLEAFRDTLKLGDEVTAEKHLTAAERALTLAARAAANDDVRTVANWPWVGNTVEDLGHLLRAAQIMTDSGRDALAVYVNFSGDDSELFRDSTFSIPAIEQAQQAVAAIEASMARAERELRQVDGDGPKGDEALAKKRSGLRQIASLREEVVTLRPLLDALPDIVGANGKKTYLVAVMNPTELRASGGAPLSVAFLQFKNGRMTVPLKGATSALTNLNSEFFWDRLTGRQDPFALQEGEAERFVNTTFNPSFLVSGEQLVRATKANFGIQTDGVIALDLVAVGQLLKVTGPIESDNYGTITQDNIAKKLLVKAYQRGSDAASVAARHDANDELMTVMLSRLTEGGGLIGKMRALAEAAPGRHLQMYFREPALQKFLVEKGMAGAIPDPGIGNLTAVYTQNGNGNKLDIYQRRTVREVVRLRPDGSALVRRTVALENPTPPYTAPFPDRKRGYDTRYATNLVINLMTEGTKVTKQPQVAMPATMGTGEDQDGRRFAKAAVMLPPDGSAKLTWEFVVPRAAVRRGDTLVLRNYVAPQPVLNTPRLVLTVLAPDGWQARPPNGWTAVDGGVRAETLIDSTKLLTVRLTRAGE